MSSAVLDLLAPLSLAFTDSNERLELMAVFLREESVGLGLSPVGWRF